MCLLILSGLKDIEIDAVCVRLNQRAVPFFRLNTYTLDSDNYAIRWADRNEGRVAFPFPLQKVTAVWNRIPINIRGYVRKEDPAEKVFLAEETFWFLHNVGSLVRNAVWVNDPVAEEKAHCKAVQLNAAANLGFHVPATLLTNSPKELTQFRRDVGQIVFKPLFHSGQITTDNDLAIYTSEVRDEHFDRLEELRFCPGFFQEYVHKEADIRVIVFGEHVFAFRVDSQAVPDGRVDWRRPAFDDLQCTEYDLDASLRDRCAEITRVLGIRTAAIDLALGVNGKHYFFEVNPGGRWLQFSAKTGKQVADTFADYLASLAR